MFKKLVLIFLLTACLTGAAIADAGHGNETERQSPLQPIQEAITGMAINFNIFESLGRQAQTEEKDTQTEAPTVTVEGGEKNVEINTSMWVPQGGYTTTISSDVNPEEKTIEAEINPVPPSGYSTDVVKEIDVLETIEVETPGEYEVSVNIADGGVSGRGRSSPVTVIRNVEVNDSSDEPPEEAGPDFGFVSVHSEDEVAVGDTLEVNVTILNSGDGEGSDSLNMNVFDQSTSSEVSLDSGESTTETFEVDVPNDYKLNEYSGTVGIGDASEEFNGFVTQSTNGPDALPGESNSPRDPDGDGLYEDINGNDELEPGEDAEALLQNLESDVVQDNIEAFDFDQDGEVNSMDTALLIRENDEVENGENPSTEEDSEQGATTQLGTEDQQGFEKGDVNMDGIVNVVDVFRVQQNIAGINNFNSTQKDLADYNEDENVSIVDAVMIQRSFLYPDPNFRIRNVDSDGVVNPGDTLLVNVTVENNGLPGVDTLKMNVFGETTSSEINLGLTSTVTETLTTRVPEDYESTEFKGSVEINGSSSEFSGSVYQRNWDKGDVNMDGELTVADAELIQRYIAETVGLNSTQRNLADFNEDGEISIADAVRIRQEIDGENTADLRSGSEESPKEEDDEGQVSEDEDRYENQNSENTGTGLLDGLENTLNFFQ